MSDASACAGGCGAPTPRDELYPSRIKERGGPWRCLTCAGKARRAKGPDVKTCGRCGAVFSATRCPERRRHPKLSNPELAAVRSEVTKKVFAAMTPTERKMHWRSREQVRTFADFDDQPDLPSSCYDVPYGLPQKTDPND